MELFIDVAYESINKFNEELCGDKVEIVRTDDSVIIVLADGLGSGVKANILSTLTSKIIATMLKKGAGLDEAVDTITHTLPICNVRKLAYSTFTILQVLNNGEAYLVEFDNPSVFFIRDGGLMDIVFESRVINGRKIRESRFQLMLDDTLIITSDGVIHAGIGRTLDLGWTWKSVANYLEESVKKGTTAKSITSHLVTMCDNLYMGKPGDDATVVTVKLAEPRQVNLFSGPPVDPKDDSKVVEQFMRGNAKKVICGGTTANIVSRVLNRDIQTSIDYSHPDIPPTATIEGIDLVTEGVLTLTHTLQIIGEYSWGMIRYRDLETIDRRDGAAQLAKILVDDCTHLRLFIGRAMNPAHQNPNFPADLSIKFKILEELAQEMVALGKRVEKFYF